MRKVLVTGGTGFIGSKLIHALLDRGDSVRVLRRARSSLTALEGLAVEYVIGDLHDRDALTRAVGGCDIVFHLAGLVDYWRASPEQVYRVNEGGTENVMAACLHAGVSRVVYTSSVSAIGMPARGAVATEETPFDRRSASFAYADSKHRAEDVVLRAVEQGLSAVIVNPATAVGADDVRMHIGNMVVAFQRGYIRAVPHGGMCLVDVEAVIQGHLAAAECGRPGERYILGGDNLSYRQIAALLAERLGRAAPQRMVPDWVLGPAAGVVEVCNRLRRSAPTISGEQIRFGKDLLFYDSSKAVRELDYPLMPFRDALSKACAWYRENAYID